MTTSSVLHHDNINREAQSPVLEENIQVSDVVDGGYGWVVVISVLLLTTQTWGINGAYGVYLAHYLDTDIFPEATELDYTFIGGLSISQITFIGPVVTKFGHVFGLHTTLVTGAIIQAGALVASSFATKIWHLYLTQGVLFGWGSGFLYIGSAGIVSQWFTKRKGLANGLSSAGSGLGGLMWSLATGAMLRNVGLSWSFRITAIVAFTVNIICAFTIKDRNHLVKPSQNGFDIALLKRYEFLLLLAWGFFSMMGYTILLFSLPNYATTIGLSANQASVVGAMVNLGMAVGRPVVGYYSDSVGRVNMAAGATFFGSLVCFFIWTFAKSYAVLIVAALLSGSVCGTFWALIASLASDILGLVELPSALSIVWTSVMIPCLFAEPIALSLRHISNTSSWNNQIFTGFMFFGGTICLLLLRTWRLDQMDEEATAEESAESETEKAPKSLGVIPLAYDWLSRSFALKKA